MKLMPVSYTHLDVYKRQEFTQKQEPTQRGADLMAGSLIKNPGGGIAPTGGYIAGRADLVELCEMCIRDRLRSEI